MKTPIDSILSSGAVQNLGNPSIEFFGDMFTRADTKPAGFDDALIYRFGDFEGCIRPITVALTDEMALAGTLAALGILGLPAHLVPCSAQIRHDHDLAPLAWFGNMPGVLHKPSTAGDALVSVGGGYTQVKGGAGNMTFRTKAGVFCCDRPYNNVLIIRFMPGYPYSQQKPEFTFDLETGDVSMRTKTSAVRMAYAVRHWIQKLVETGQPGLGVLKPTIAQEDAVLAAIAQRLMQQAGIQIKKDYAVDYAAQYVAELDALFANHLPADFMAGVQGEGHVNFVIADLGYEGLIDLVINREEAIVFSNDGDGDRLTDLNAGIMKRLRKFGEMLLSHNSVQCDVSIDDLLAEMGYATGTGFDATSVMHRMEGEPIPEQVLGTAPDLFKALMKGGDPAYDLRVHLHLFAQAYEMANGARVEIIDDAITRADTLYEEHPGIGFLQAYRVLADA